MLRHFGFGLDAPRLPDMLVLKMHLPRRMIENMDCKDRSVQPLRSFSAISTRGQCFEQSSTPHSILCIMPEWISSVVSEDIHPIPIHSRSAPCSHHDRTIPVRLYLAIGCRTPRAGNMINKPVVGVLFLWLYDKTPTESESRLHSSVSAALFGVLGASTTCRVITALPHALKGAFLL